MPLIQYFHKGNILPTVLSSSEKSPFFDEFYPQTTEFSISFYITKGDNSLALLERNNKKNPIDFGSKWKE